MFAKNDRNKGICGQRPINRIILALDCTLLLSRYLKKLKSFSWSDYKKKIPKKSKILFFYHEGGAQSPERFAPNPSKSAFLTFLLFEGIEIKKEVLPSPFSEKRGKITWLSLMPCTSCKLII